MKSRRQKNTSSSPSTTASSSRKVIVDIEVGGLGIEFKTGTNQEVDKQVAAYMSGIQWTPEQLRRIQDTVLHSAPYTQGINQIKGLTAGYVIQDEISSFLGPSERAWRKAFKQAYGTVPTFYRDASYEKRRKIETKTENLAKQNTKAGHMAARVVAARVAFTIDAESRASGDDMLDSMAGVLYGMRGKP